MVSKVCSRSQGHPPGPRSRAMMDTARSKRSPVVAILHNLKDEGQRRKGCCLPTAKSASVRPITSTLFRFSLQYAHGLLQLRSEEHTSELQSLRHLVCR